MQHNGLTWTGLLRAGEALLAAAEGATPEAAESMRRRAVSTAYYAVFHFVCEAAAHQLASGLPDSVRGDVYRRAYRTLDHGKIKTTAARLVQSMQQPDCDPAYTGLIDLCTLLVRLYNERQAADYDPEYSLSQEDAVKLIETVGREMLLLEFLHDEHQVRILVAELLVRQRDR